MWVGMYTGISEGNISRLLYSKLTTRGRCSSLAGRIRQVNSSFLYFFSLLFPAFQLLTLLYL